MSNIFYIFSTLLVICAFMVIISKHPIFSLLFLVSSFFFSSCLLFLLECEFLAFLFIIVYVGAIGILFLFAIMMLESKLNDLARNVIQYVSIGTIFGIMFFVFSFFPVSENFKYSISNSFYLNNEDSWYDVLDSVTDIESYGQILYSYFVLQFLVAGLILLLVLVSVVYLTNIYIVDDQALLEQSSFKQLARESKFFSGK